METHGNEAYVDCSKENIPRRSFLHREHKSWDQTVTLLTFEADRPSNPSAHPDTKDIFHPGAKSTHNAAVFLLSVTAFQNCEDLGPFRLSRESLLKKTLDRRRK